MMSDRLHSLFVEWLGANTVSSLVAANEAGPFSTVDLAFFRVMEGQAFYAERIGAVASDATMDVIFDSGDACSILYRVEPQTEFRLMIYADPVFTGGTGITPVNMNDARVRDGTAATVQSGVLHTPTVTDVGTLISTNISDVSPGIVAAVATIIPGTRWITAPGVKYLARVQNLSNVERDMKIAAQWCEGM